MWQKFRLHTRRPSPMIPNINNANPQTAPFVLVGNIFVQPPEYATASGEVTPVTAPTGIYAPVAAHPPGVVAPFLKKKSLTQVKQLMEHNEQSHSEEERVNHSSEGAVHSNSPASSCSTHTTSTSHKN